MIVLTPIIQKINKCQISDHNVTINKRNECATFLNSHLYELGCFYWQPLQVHTVEQECTIFLHKKANFIQLNLTANHSARY